MHLPVRYTVVLNQVPIQSLAQVPDQVTSQIFQKSTQLSASHMGAPLFFTKNGFLALALRQSEPNLQLLPSVEK